MKMVKFVLLLFAFIGFTTFTGSARAEKTLALNEYLQSVIEQNGNYKAATSLAKSFEMRTGQSGWCRLAIGSGQRADLRASLPKRDWPTSRAPYIETARHVRCSMPYPVSLVGLCLELAAGSRAADASRPTKP